VFRAHTIALRLQVNWPVDIETAVFIPPLGVTIECVIQVEQVRLVYKPLLEKYLRVMAILFVGNCNYWSWTKLTVCIMLPRAGPLTGERSDMLIVLDTNRYTVYRLDVVCLYFLAE
jgi:hypothetical protein